MEKGTGDLDEAKEIGRVGGRGPSRDRAAPKKKLQYLSANVRNSQRCDEWEQRLKGKTKRLKGMVTTNIRLLTALSLLLIIAGDVELNPGPIGDGKRASNCICIEVTRL